MDDQKKPHPAEPFGARGDAASTGLASTSGRQTPLRPSQVTLGPLEREMGETPELAVIRDPETSPLADGRSADEREDKGIIDESRHTSSLGQR